MSNETSKIEPKLKTKSKTPLISGANDAKKRVKGNRGLDIHLHAEVARVMTIGANGYNVAYA